MPDLDLIYIEKKDCIIKGSIRLGKIAFLYLIILIRDKL